MCFSAGASFSAAVVLSSVGIATIREVGKPSHRLFASIPLFFAVQQFAEGIVWTALRPGGNDSILHAAAYFFLFMALIAWPLMIPFSVYRMEENHLRKKIIRVFAFAGVILSSYYAFCLINMDVYPRIDSFHICYDNNFPEKAGYVAFAFYAIVTITPLFISGIKRMSLFAYLILFSCFVTGIFYREFLTSVWCFFAALMSAVIYLIIKEAQEDSQFAAMRLIKLFPGNKHH